MIRLSLGKQEWLQNLCYLIHGNILRVCLAELWDKDITYVQADTLSALTIQHQLHHRCIEPLDCTLLVLEFLDQEQSLVEHVSQEGKEFINPKVVKLIPVLV